MRFVMSAALLILATTPVIAAAEGARAPSEAAVQAAIDADRAGKGHYVSGEYLEAAAQFRKAYFSFNPDPKYLFNLCKSLENGGQLSNAYLCKLAYLEANPAYAKAGELKAELAELLASAGADFGVVDVRCASPASALYVKFEPQMNLGSPPKHLLLPVGSHQLLARGPGGEVKSAVEVRSGEMTQHWIGGQPAKAKAVGAGSAIRRSGAEIAAAVKTAGSAIRKDIEGARPGERYLDAIESADRRLAVTGVFLGVGVAAVAAGAYVWHQRPAECPSGSTLGDGIRGPGCYQVDTGLGPVGLVPKVPPSDRTFEQGLLAVGAVSLTVGVVMLVSGPSDALASPWRLAVTPAGATMGAHWSW